MSGTILILDDVATNRIVMKVRLAKACYQTQSAASLAEGLELARQARPEVIVMGATVGTDGMPAALARLRRDPATAGVPCVVVTAEGDIAGRALALAAGAADALSCPIDDRLLTARLRHVLRAQAERQGSEAAADGWAEPAASGAPIPAPQIALIWHDRAQALSWKHALSARLGRPPVLVSPEAALHAAPGEDAAGVYLITADLAASGEGLRLMAELRSRPATRRAVICLVVPPAAVEVASQALDLGADEVLAVDITRPAALDEVEARLRACLRRRAAIEASHNRIAAQLREAMTDPLTGLPNRRSALAQLTRVADASLREGRDWAVLVIDIDRFKQVNDTHGHAAGDAALAAVAARMAALVPAPVLLARLGGEEFVALIPQGDRAQAVAVAQGLCDGLASQPVRLIPQPGIAIPEEIALTVSVGVALGHAGEAGPQVLNRADRALLAAKAAGRNRVTLAVLRASVEDKASATPCALVTTARPPSQQTATAERPAAPAYAVG